MGKSLLISTEINLKISVLFGKFGNLHRVVYELFLM